MIKTIEDKGTSDVEVPFLFENKGEVTWHRKKIKSILSGFFS